ncbi:TonB-dependent receptor plug domain-containing protein [Aquicoccus porphyridii]|uniref:TonB-dependent receptor plug domain-containing protein n=1 Tax=Aquicoccus porphyridii TaxID=1852029 RepID=UPI00273D9539|nr:TonB-dependent receptor [Aquicoccus porphyridii]
MIRPVTRTGLMASCAIAALIVQAPVALAQDEDVTDLGTIVLSGSLIPQPMSRTGATVDVLEEDDLDGDTRPLADTLSRKPGLSFAQSGPLGTTSSLSIRGLPARYIGVRIDGIDVTDAAGTQAQFDFGGMTNAGLGRVELLKGSQSALYGSEAIGGVVDISTARPSKLGFSTRVGAEAGSHGTYSGNLMLGYKDDRGEVALNVSRIESDGFSALSDNTEKDGAEQSLASLTLRYALSDNVTVGGSVLYRDLDFDFDNMAGDPSGTGQTRQRGARVFAEVTTGRVTHELSYSHFDSQRDLATSTYTATYDSTRDQIAYLGSASLGGAANAVLNFGLDYTEERYKTVGSADTRSAFAELLLQPGDVDLSLALRHDEHSQFGGHASGRIAGVWHVTGSTDIRAALATGFRAPSLNELYGPFGGNPNLDPEQSRNAELGIEHRFGSVGSIRGTLFYTEVDDLIDYNFPTGYVQVPGTSVSKGFEMSGRYALSDQYTVYGAYTYVDAKDGNGMRRVRVPRNTLVLGLDAEFTPKLSGNIEVKHANGAEASAFAPAGHKVGEYTLVNVGVEYAVMESVKAYLRVENLTDEDYETVGGYNQPGRSVFFGVRAEF